MTETEALQVEATGETVGEAKWSAVREIENGISLLPAAAGRFPQVSGLTVAAEASRPAGSRITSIKVGDLPLDEAKTYRVATNDFMARGGDGYVTLRNGRALLPIDDSPLLANEVMNYVSTIGTITTGIEVRCRIEIEEDDETLTATLGAPELGRVIGKHGQTIDAIQYLVNAIVWRERGEERKPVVIDAAGYRARREVTLNTLAARSAERALSSGRPVELDPMTAVERKIVHVRLQDVPGVTTRSEGTEPNRYVVIEPE